MPLSPAKLKMLKWTINKGGISMKPVVLKATEEEMRNRVKHGDNTVALLTNEIRDPEYLKQMARIELTIADFETLAVKVLKDTGYNIQELPKTSKIMKGDKECLETNTTSNQPTQKKPSGTTQPWWKRWLKQENQETKQKDS